MIIALIVFFFGEHLLRLFDIEGKVFDYGLIFVRICGASLFLESLSLALSAVLRSHGFTKESMVVTVIMDLISIGGKHSCNNWYSRSSDYGCSRCSWAIVVARSFAVLALIYFVYKRLSLRLTFSDLFKAKEGGC